MNISSSFLGKITGILLFFSFCVSPFLAFTSFAENGNESSTPDNTEAEKEVDSTIYLREAFPGQESTIDGGQGSLSLLAEYVSMIFKYTAALGAIIAVLVIMFAGFQLMVSGDGNEALGNAKTMIQKTLTGVALLFLAGLILYTVNPNFYIFS